MRHFIAQGTNEGFTCQYCEHEVLALQNGSVRNHCPHCLYSLHVDVFPGDRANDCGGLMQPTGVEYHAKKGWVILYHCTSCGATGRNKAALDDPEQADDYEQIVRLSQQS